MKENSEVKYHLSKIPVYGGVLVVAIGGTNQKIHEIFDMDYIGDPRDMRGTLAFAYNYNSRKERKRRYLLWLPKMPPSGRIRAHEIVHVVNKVFDDVGVDLDVLNDEPQAYFTDTIWAMIEGAVKEIKNGNDMDLPDPFSENLRKRAVCPYSIIDERV